MMKVKLKRPLDGKVEGDMATYPKLDAERLEKRGLVEILGDADLEANEDEAPANKQEAEPANKAAPRPKKKAD